MPKTKVLHVTSTPRGIGGVERLLLDLAPHYDRDRFEILHCNLFDATEGRGPFPAGLREAGLRSFEIAGRGWLDVPAILWRLRALIEREKVDVVHLHMAHGTIVGGMAAALSACRTVITKHYSYEMLSSAPLAALDKSFTNRADAVIAVSEYVESDLLRHGAPRDRIRIIHNGIDLARFDQRAAQSPSSDANLPWLTIGCVGGLHPLKGQDRLLRAMPLILRDVPNARLLLLGEGQERERLENLAHSLGIANAITFRGFCPNVPAALSAIDLYVLPSRNESFGIVLLEAMAARLSVVATAVGGISEIVEPGVTGLLAEPGNPVSIAEAACSLLKNEDRRRAFGVAGRSRVERHFDIASTARAYEDTYEFAVCSSR